MTLRNILASDDTPQSILYDIKTGYITFKNWETHNVFIDGVKEVKGGIVEIYYTTVDEDGDPESTENLTLDTEIPVHVENSLRYLIKENFKIKPKIISYINFDLGDYLEDYYLAGRLSVDLYDILSNLHKHIALERIELHSKNHNGFVKVSYVFATSWHWQAIAALEVLVLNDTPEDMIESVRF